MTSHSLTWEQIDRGYERAQTLRDKVLITLYAIGKLAIEEPSPSNDGSASPEALEEMLGVPAAVIKAELEKLRVEGMTEREEAKP